MLLVVGREIWKGLQICTPQDSMRILGFVDDGRRWSGWWLLVAKIQWHRSVFADLEGGG